MYLKNKRMIMKKTLILIVQNIIKMNMRSLMSTKLMKMLRMTKNIKVNNLIMASSQVVPNLIQTMKKKYRKKKKNQY